MSMEFLDSLISYLYYPSLVALLLSAFLAPIRLEGLSAVSKLARFFVGIYLGITVAACSALFSFSYDGCFENCSDKVDGEIGIIWASIINYMGSVLIFSFLSKSSHSKQRQSDV
ncbi:hypothetical protein Misp06_03091 [Microbulbifer sp. NBRC 101763]